MKNSTSCVRLAHPVATNRPAVVIAGSALALALLMGGPSGAWAAPVNSTITVTGDQTTPSDKSDMPIVIKPPIIVQDPPKDPKKK